MTAAELKRLFPNASKSTIAVNQDSPVVAGLQDTQRQRDKRSQSEDSQLDKSENGLAFSIVIISIRHKRIDAHDNIRTGAKPLVDLITTELGFASDDNPRLQWNYEQIITAGPEGTIVMIQRL